MRSLQRNMRTMWYRLYQASDLLTYTDEYGNELSIGETGQTYSDPVEIKANISTASGAVLSEPYGRIPDYDKVIATSNMNCPIDENSVLYIDTEPVRSDGEWSAHDYIVVRIAKSLNDIRIFAKRVDVS